MSRKSFFTIIFSFFVLLALSAGFALAQESPFDTDCSIQNEIPMGKTIDNAEKLADEIYAEFKNIYDNAEDATNNAKNLVDYTSGDDGINSYYCDAGNCSSSITDEGYEDCQTYSACDCDDCPPPALPKKEGKFYSFTSPLKKIFQINSLDEYYKSLIPEVSAHTYWTCTNEDCSSCECGSSSWTAGCDSHCTSCDCTTCANILGNPDGPADACPLNRINPITEDNDPNQSGSVIDNFDEISDSYDTLIELIKDKPDIPAVPESNWTGSAITSSNFQNNNCDTAFDWYVCRWCECTGGCNPEIRYGEYQFTGIDTADLDYLNIEVSLLCHRSENINNCGDIMKASSCNVDLKFYPPGNYAAKFSTNRTFTSASKTTLAKEFFNVDSNYVDASGNLTLRINYDEHQHLGIIHSSEAARIKGEKPEAIPYYSIAGIPAVPGEEGLPKKILNVLNESRDGLYGCKVFISDWPDAVTGRIADKELYTCDKAKKFLNIFSDVRSSPLNQSEKCGELISSTTTTVCDTIPIDDIESDCQCYCFDEDEYTDSALDFFCCYY